MPNCTSSNAKDERIVREFATTHAPGWLTIEGELSVLDDVRVSAAGIALGRGRCREIVREVYDAARAERKAKGAEIRECVKRDAENAQDGNKGPVCPVDAAGLAVGLDLAGYEVRWNETAERVEIREKGTGQWIGCDGWTHDDVFYAVSKVIRMDSPHGPVDWDAKVVRKEKRLLGVCGRCNSQKGEGGAVYDTVYWWAVQVRTQRMPLRAVLQEAGVLNRYEVSARSPEFVERAARRALSAAGWVYKVCRVQGVTSPRKLWCAPGGSKGACLQPTSYKKR